MQQRTLNSVESDIFIVASPSIGYVRDVVRGVAEAAARIPGWNVDVLDVSIESALERARGLVVFTTTAEQDAIIHRRQIPTVGVSARNETSMHPQVLPDNVAIGRLGAEHLLAAGFRNFGFCGIRGHWYSQLRGQGFLTSLEEAGMTASLWHEEMRVMGQWVSDLPKPVGLMAANDERATRLLREVKSLGLRVPEDVAIMGVDNDEVRLELVRPTLTSVDINGRVVGVRAAELLNELMNGKGGPTVPILIPPLGVVPRQSTDLLNIDDPGVNTAVRFIRNNCCRNLTVQDIANELTVSRRWLERRFQEYLKRSPAEVLRQARVDRVKSQLASSDQSMAEIARRTGFSSPQQMSRIFATLVGSSPSDFRRLRMENSTR